MTVTSLKNIRWQPELYPSISIAVTAKNIWFACLQKFLETTINKSVLDKKLLTIDNQQNTMTLRLYCLKVKTAIN